VHNGNGSFTYSPASGFNGNDSFTYAIDDGRGGTSSAIVNITVNSVNDAPVMTVPVTQTTVEDAALQITGIGVTDADVNDGTGNMKVSLAVGSGKLTLSTSVPGGLTAAGISGNGTGAVVLLGSIESVNKTLAAGITYLGNLDFNGTDTLYVVADDLGNTGSGGSRTDNRTVSIRVLSPAEQIARLRSMVDVLYL